jgi:hypothetical protein
MSRFYKKNTSKSYKEIIDTKEKRMKEIKERAHEIFSDKEKLNKYLWKTRVCKYENNCYNPDKCSGAHYLEEYRIPECLHFEFCNKNGCNYYHAHLGTKEEYMKVFGIKFKKDTKEEFENSRKFKKDVKNCTRLCINMTEEKMCDKVCTFAHSVDELVLPDNSIKDDETKKDAIERIFKIKVHPFMMRESWQNNIFLKKKQEELVIEIFNDDDDFKE